jgi:GTP cyclohydrolase I
MEGKRVTRREASEKTKIPKSIKVFLPQISERGPKRGLKNPAKARKEIIREIVSGETERPREISGMKG